MRKQEGAMTGTRNRRTQRGFTLVELAIVLAVAAVLFAGLWKLIGSGNTQLRDQAAADQQKSLIAAVRGYLATAQGQGLITATAANGNFSLNIAPPCTGNAGLCNFLPAGFTNTTTNSYGQTYAVRVLKDSAAAGTPAQSYSFMIKTTGVTVIPDTSGGRIASMIGSDGGFIYTANVCGAPTGQWACGAYGSWSADVQGTYGFAASASGTVASRSFAGLGATPLDPWLARNNSLAGAGTLPGGTPDFNTLQADTFMDGTASFNLNGSTLFGSRSGGTPGGLIDLLQEGIFSMVNNTDNPAITARSPCLKANQNDASCGFALQVTGDQNVQGLLVANQLFAGSFIYNAPSDIRLKHDVRPLSRSLQDLSRIRAVSFAMNQNNEKKVGVLAQDVEKVYPELVHDIGGGYKGVDYIGLIGPLVGAVNELKDANDRLRQQVKAQEEAVNRLENRLRSRE
jgi:prepilin-type N-terminal cleavage/methylation domain-containing protein